MDRQREGLSFWKGMALKTNPPLGLFLEYTAEAGCWREGGGNMHVASVDGQTE